MKHDLELKIQAWVDGELQEREARRMADWIEGHAEASALAEELSRTRQAMIGQEMAATLSESRDFYWSKIQRQIAGEAAPGHARIPWTARWRRFLAPLAGAAALACVVLMSVRHNAPSAFDDFSSTGAGMEAVTFQDQSAQMTVIWLQDASSPPAKQAAAPSVRYEDEPGTVIDLH